MSGSDLPVRDRRSHHAERRRPPRRGRPRASEARAGGLLPPRRSNRGVCANGERPARARPGIRGRQHQPAWCTTSERRPLQPAIADLYVNTRGQAVPPDPYAGYGLMFRVWNYRHQVTHRERNPFHLKVGLNDALTLGAPEPLPEHVRRFAERGDRPTAPSAHFLLDPPHRLERA